MARTTLKPLATLAVAVTTAVVVFSVHRVLVRGGAGGPVERSARGPAAEPDARIAPPRAPREESRQARAPAPADAAPRRDPADGLTAETPETFRNTSILMAIRDKGFQCTDIVSAAAGAQDMTAWRVACDGALVYLVVVDASGALTVDPMPYGDGVSFFNADPSDPSAPRTDRPAIQLVPPPR